MQILAKRTPAMMLSCPECRVLFAYNFGDIYQNKYVYCPVCRTKITTPIDLGYDGVVKQNGNNDKKEQKQ